MITTLFLIYLLFWLIFLIDKTREYIKYFCHGVTPALQIVLFFLMLYNCDNYIYYNCNDVLHLIIASDVNNLHGFYGTLESFKWN